MKQSRFRPLISVVAALFILTGCAGNSPPPAASQILRNTQKTIASAYEKTKNAVVKTYNRIINKKPEEPKADAVNKAPSSGSRVTDRKAGTISTGKKLSYEADIRAGRVKPITKVQVRGSGSSTLHIVPRSSLVSGELRRKLADLDKELEREKIPPRRQLLINRRKELFGALQNAQMEETILREMNKLRGRLRMLEEKLKDVRKARLGKKP